MAKKVRLVIFMAMLFAVVAVDFVSSLMSMAFDLMFVSGALIAVYPSLFGKSDG